MALTDEVQQIIDGYEFEVSSYGSLFGFGKGKIINLKADITNELFLNLFTKTCELFGMPIFVHSYYGYIWKVNGEVLAYNLYEKNYNYNVVAFFILNKMPMGKKLKYCEYLQIDKVVKQILAEHNLNCNSFVHYIDGKFMFLGENSEEQYFIILKPLSLEFYCSKKEPYKDGMIKVAPCYSRKKAISLTDISNVKQTLQNCFIDK